MDVAGQSAADRRNQPISPRRDLANLRERRRMLLINRAFETLKNRLPREKLKSPRHHRLLAATTKFKSCRVTKVDILRLTIDYIQYLKTLLGIETKLNSNPIQMMAHQQQYNGTELEISNNSSHGLKSHETIKKFGNPKCNIMKPKLDKTKVIRKKRSARFNKINSKSLIDKTKTLSYVFQGDHEDGSPQPQQIGSRLIFCKDANQQFTISWAKTGPTLNGQGQQSKEGAADGSSDQQQQQHELGGGCAKKLRNTKLWIPAQG